MSIIRQLVVTSIVEALRGRTLAGNCVFDSRINSLEGFEEQQVVIIVSAEDSKADVRGQASRGFFGRNAEIAVLVQTCIYAGFKREIDDEEPPLILESDASLEGALNLLDRSWKHVLSQPNPTDKWTQIFQDLVLNIGELREARATDPETGVKHAARFVSFKLDVIAEPTIGDELAPVIATALQAMEDDGDHVYKQLAADWRVQLGSGVDLPDGRKLQSALFATNDAMRGIGLNEADPETAEVEDDP